MTAENRWLRVATDKELLEKFSDYLDAALNVDIDAQIRETSNIPKELEKLTLRCHRHALQAYKLRLHPGAFVNPERTKQKALAVVKSYAMSHSLRPMKRADCSAYPARSFERATLGAFFGFLQILQATGSSM